MKFTNTATILFLCLFSFTANSFADAVFLRPISAEDNQSLRELGVSERNLKKLASEGTVRSYRVGGHAVQGIWSGSYWPMVQGGITYRWQTGENPNQIATFDSILGMSQAQRDTLSPAEKYDFYKGDRRMSLSHSERAHIERAKKSNGGKLEGWFGYCDGAASGGIGEKEPLFPANTKAQGLPLTFYPNDLKALASSLYVHSNGANVAMGKRCEKDFQGRPILDFFTKAQNPACNDTNPGAFHLALTNRLADNKSFVMEIDRGAQIWNHAVYGYKTLSSNWLPGGVGFLRRRVDMMIYYVDGITPSRTRQFKLGQKQLDYTLHIDRRTGDIIGGRWNHEASRGGSVDFIWNRQQAGTDKRGLIDIATLRNLITLAR